MGRRCEIDGTYIADDNGHGGSVQRVCSGRCRVEACRRRKAIPEGMKALRRWTRADGKRPIRPDGKPASSTKPDTWSAFEQVANAGEGDGWGIMLGGGLACYDLDHILDEQGRVKPRHPGRSSSNGSNAKAACSPRSAAAAKACTCSSTRTPRAGNAKAWNSTATTASSA